jgi:hypothetical protein
MRNPFKRLYSRLDNFFSLRATQSRKFQSDLDWFRFATLGELRRLAPQPDAAVTSLIDRLSTQRANTHRRMAVGFYTKELNRLLKAG